MRSVFLSSGAYLGRVDSATRCAFWADDPSENDFDPKRLVTIDLSRTPNAAAAGEISWDAVEVDDCFSGPNGELAGTTLGPRWPELQLTGAVLLEQQFVNRLPRELRPSYPPKRMHGRAYEYTSVVYWPHVDDPRAGNRYNGHHAEIVEERGTLARVVVYPPGTSDRTNARPLPMWIDLSSPEQCDAGRDALTEIGVGDAPKQGALFLISGRLQPVVEDHE
jgi:hypothetical protein